MKDNIDKHIEKLVDKTMKKASLESPSFNFTNTVMTQVKALENNTITTYKPLISKPMWFTILIITLAIVFYIVFGMNTAEASWLNFIDLSILTDNKFSDAMSGFKVSNTVMYGVVLFGIMLFIQVPILKHYFDKSLTA